MIFLSQTKNIYHPVYTLQMFSTSYLFTGLRTLRSLQKPVAWRPFIISM